MGELQKRIEGKAKKLSLGQPWVINATKYKAGLMILDTEDLHGIVEEFRKEVEVATLNATFTKDVQQLIDCYTKWLSDDGGKT